MFLESLAIKAACKVQGIAEEEGGRRVEAHVEVEAISRSSSHPSITLLCLLFVVCSDKIIVGGWAFDLVPLSHHFIIAITSVFTSWT